MTEPSIPVGFDYAKALLHIRSRMTYEDIAAYLGYGSVGSISNIISGRIPNHPQGEAIFTLYLKLFGKKPPMSEAQARGVEDFHERASVSHSSTV